MKILSLFDGISCARVALERAGIPVETYYASEIDKYAIQVSQKNYPDIKHIGNVTEIQYDHALNQVWEPMTFFRYETGQTHGVDIDLLIGGSPCQDLSIAKRDRKGLDGERSGLFWEYVRILKEVRPKYFILENVASMPKEAKAIITEALGVEPIMINAALVSAQQRKRLFWTNIPNVTLPEDRGIFLKDIIESGDTDRLKSYCIDANYWKGTNLEQYKKKARRQVVFCIGSLQKHASILEEKSTPMVSAMGMGGGHVPMVTEDFIQIRKLTPVECERLQGLPDNYTEGISSTQRYKCCGNAFNVDVVAHILSFIPTFH